jgi:DNA (cytosine-5)-methyltransferase 1
MTIHEAKLIQSFPPDFTISGGWGEAMRQIGNAVPVRLAEIVGRRLFDVLSSEGKPSHPHPHLTKR